MLSPASRLLVNLMVAALATGVLYQIAIDERAGTVLFLAAAVAALVAAVATGGSAVPDRAPPVPADAPPPERRATTTGAAPRGSGWPAGAALALAVLAATAAAGGPVVGLGVIAVVFALVGWSAKVWTEDPAWTPRVSERINRRLVLPAGLPVGMFLLAAVIAVSLSRILLAVDKNVAVLIALMVGMLILAGCWWVSSRPRISTSSVLALVALAAVSVAGAGVTGVAAGEREFHAHEEHGQVVHVEAEEVAFNTDEIKVTADEEVTIEFANHDADVYHNIAVYKSDAPDAQPLFNGLGFPGADERTYHFEAPPPGAYVFVCDFHPNMKGAFVAEAE